MALASSIDELLLTGCKKLDIRAQDCTIVLEEDGTEVDDDDILAACGDKKLMFLQHGETWSSASEQVQSAPVVISSCEPQPPPQQDTRCALGRLAKIGDLYDMTSDCFTGHSVYSDNAPVPCINTIRVDEIKQDFYVDDSFKNKLDALKVESNLQLSVATGLAGPEGDMAYFLNDPQGALTIRGTIINTQTTVDERVDNPVDIRTLAANDAGTATHVVVGIRWGGIAAVSFERRESETRMETSDMHRELQQDLQSFADLSKLQYDTDMQSFLDNRYAIKFYTNCGQFRSQMPVSVYEALSQILIFPADVREISGGKGVPLSYFMIPLNSERAAKSAISHLEESETTRITKVFEELTLGRAKLSQCETIVRQGKDNAPESEMQRIVEFKYGLSNAETVLRAGLGANLIAFRSTGAGKQNLNNSLEQFEHGPFSTGNMFRLLEELQPLMTKMSFTAALSREGVIIVGGNKTHFDKLMLQANVYVLFAAETAKLETPEVWVENAHIFFEVVKEERNKNQRTRTVFGYVDCETLMKKLRMTKSRIVLCHYQNGKIVCRDVVEDRAILASLNRVRSSRQMKTDVARPPQKAFLELRCPGPSCGDSHQMWTCEMCRQPVEYGFDSHFYCLCGRAPMDTFSYKCSGVNHSNDFFQFDSLSLGKLIHGLSPSRIFTILLLGETGVGKSTWINGFANYLTFDTLEEAEHGDTVSIIPSKFTMTNEDYEEVEIDAGRDANEDSTVGQSATQMPKTYSFRRGNTHVRLIDTPGIGDTRGIDKDRENMQNIMIHLANLEEINGIIILLKPNNARLTVMFSFCIKELLTHLHRDASKNIVFCFTNARSTFYRPGDTLPALKQLLFKSHDIGIQISKETVYCFDNEAMRFLAALKHGMQFDDVQKKDYATSWDISVRETNRLMEHVSSLTPHKVKNSVSLNDARRLVVALSRPIAEIGANIRDNISVVEQKKKEISDSLSRKNRLANDKLQVQVVYLETTQLGYPRTVCTDRSCVEYVSTGVSSIKATHYRTHCHPHCYISGTEKNTVNCTSLQRCAAMTGPNHVCGTCGHSWSVHMHITYDIAKKSRLEEDSEIQKLIANESTYIQGIQMMQKDLEDRVRKLESEEKTVTEVSARFACFLKINAIAPYNDALADYLDHLIRDEQGKVGAGGERETLIRLERMKAMYEKEVQALELAFQNTNVQPATAGDIRTLYDNVLCKLQFSGPNLRNIMRVVESADAAADAYSEMHVPVRVRPKRRGGAPYASSSYSSRAMHWVTSKLPWNWGIGNR